MRVNLNCPYADKERAKRFGARWDPEAKTWYVIDPPDLLRFSKWLRAYPAQDRPTLQAAQPHKPKKSRKPKKHKQRARQIVEGEAYATTGPAVFQPLCNCDVHPWDDCAHTEQAASQAMMEILSLTTATYGEST